MGERKIEYAELQVTSNFSFLRGASHPEEMVGQAAALGYRALALTDHNTLAGIVRAHIAARDQHLRFLVGARLQVIAGMGHALPIAMWPQVIDAIAAHAR